MIYQSRSLVTGSERGGVVLHRFLRQYSKTYCTPWLRVGNNMQGEEGEEKSEERTSQHH